jgi:hypothetical protein
MVIESTESNQTSEDNVEEIFMNYVKSNNPMDRLFAVSKVNSLLTGYRKAKFEDPLDVKLVTGIFKRNTEINDFIQRFNNDVTKHSKSSAAVKMPSDFHANLRRKSVRFELKNEQKQELRLNLSGNRKKLSKVKNETYETMPTN